MGSVVAGAGVNPADQPGLSGRSCHCVSSCCYGSEGLVPEMSLEFCATGLDGVQLSFSPPVVELHHSAENWASSLL